MPQISEKAIRRYLPLLLIAAIALALMNDKMRLDSPKIDSTAALKESAVHDHNHEGEDPHDDPVKNRRMGIYHFNEGNKFLASGEWDEAVRNYKMALHHDAEIHEVYTNLSTAYLKSQRYDEAYQTLQILKEKTPENPLLHYNLACHFALTDKLDDSFAALNEAVKFGFKDFGEIESDPDLENLRKDPRYVEWVRPFKKKP